jgi:DNA uptake protein ComE-like DNA-binding protein
LSKDEYTKHIEEAELSQITIRDSKELSKGLKEKLERAGYFTMQNLEDIDEKELMQIPGIGKSKAKKILKSYEKATKELEENK